MEQGELEGQYERLKDELARAYSSPAWNSPHIDRLARELLAIERIASARKGGAAFLIMQGRATACVLTKRAAPDSSRRPPSPAEVATGDAFVTP